MFTFFDDGTFSLVRYAWPNGFFIGLSFHSAIIKKTCSATRVDTKKLAVKNPSFMINKIWRFGKYV